MGGEGIPRSRPSWRPGLAVLLLAMVACTGNGEGRPPPTLPAAAAVADDFERDVLGFAEDREAAEVRFQECMENAGYPVAHLDIDEYMALGQDEANQDFRLLDMLCHQAAGTGWGPGNRPDEVAVLNQQAWNTTECVREHGWEFPDPIEEEFGRFLRFAGARADEFAPTDIESAAQYKQDLGECFDQNAVDWDAWRRQNPRN